MHVLFSRLARWSESQPASLVAAVAALAVAGIGYADYVTGAHLSFALLYLLPVSFATWYGNRNAAILVSLAATLSWFMADFYTYPLSATAAAPYWNTAVRLIMFWFVASPLLSIRRFSQTLRQTVDERTRLLRHEVEERKRTEARLAMLAHAVESTVEMICITDEENRFLFANRAFQEGYGYAAAEIMGRTPEMLLSPANPPGLAVEILEQTRRGGWRGELINRRRDGSEFPAFLSTSRLLDRSGQLIGLMGIAQDITDRRRAAEALRRQADALRLEVARRAALEREMAELTTEEHHRLARDLHDGAGQYLAGLAFHARILAEELESRGAPEREQARRLEELIRATNRELRQLDKILRPATSELGGLPAALRRLIEEVQQMVGVRCALRVPEMWFSLPDFPALMLFRIAQEALNNALKHGQGRAIEIVLELENRVEAEPPGFAVGHETGLEPAPGVFRPRLLRLTVRDAGPGLPESTPDEGDGLRIMRYRAQLIGAQLAVRSTPGHGCTVTCEFPLSIGAVAAAGA